MSVGSIQTINDLGIQTEPCVLSGIGKIRLKNYPD